MDRREFIKVVGAAMAAMSSGGVLEAVCSTVDVVPSKYRGFDIRIDEVCKPYGYVQQLFVSNGKYHQAILFDEKDEVEIWNKYKPYLDQAIDRFEKKVA